MTVVADLTQPRTLGNLKDRIGLELARTQEFGTGGTLTDLCALAIDDAISEAATFRFWFNELRGLTLNIVSGQEYYGSEDFSYATEIDAMWFMRGTQRMNMYVANNNELNALADGNTSQGEPFRFSIYADRMRIWPIPTRGYTVTYDCVSRLEPLTDDAYFNAWTNEGERYIRALAKRNLLNDVIDDPEAADRQAVLAEKYKADLLSKTHARASTGDLRPWCG